MWSNYRAELLISDGVQKIRQALPDLKRPQSSLKVIPTCWQASGAYRHLAPQCLSPNRHSYLNPVLNFKLVPSAMTPSLLRVTLKRGWTLSSASQINLVTVEERSGSLLGGLRSSPISSLISLWSSSTFLPNWILQERCPSAADLSYPEIGGD